MCPASWYLGEDAKVVVFSTTEGEDKPLKYPKVFQVSQYGILNKIDLLPYLSYDPAKAAGYARDVNPNLDLFFTSATSGEGMDEWYQLLRNLVNHTKRTPALSMPAV